MNSLDKYNELEAEKRMKIIAQNGNNVKHYELPLIVTTNKDKCMVNKYGKKENLTEYYSIGKVSYDFGVDDDGYCFEYTYLIDSSKEDFDTDGTLHKAKIAWRGLAGLQKHLEENK